MIGFALTGKGKMMLIIDMKMPKCCDECPMLDDNGDYPTCRITEESRGYTFNTREKRMDRCPIKGELVQCKDCKKQGTDNCEIEYWRYGGRSNNWYCKSGESKVGEV